MLVYIPHSAFSVFLYLYLVQGSPPAPAHSPEAHTDLICHTAQASDCYPAIFQPTEHFQPIHDDQSIPPGLHVRLNLATGLKEARLNVPEPDDAPKADLVLIDNQPSFTGEEQAPLIPEVPAPREASAPPRSGYDFNAPLPEVPDDEADQFEYYRHHAIRIFPLRDVTSLNDEVLRALTALTELAHSWEWGLAITSDPYFAQTFLDYIDPVSASPIEIQSAAVQLLGTAIQNNHEAVDALHEHFLNASHPQVKPVYVIQAALKNSSEKGPTAENTKLQKRLLFLLYQLSRDIGDINWNQLAIFASDSGLLTLLAIFDTEPMYLGDGRDKIRTRVADFLLDFILPDMATWTGEPLVDEAPSDMDRKMKEGRNVWIDAMGDIGSWCFAFNKAIKMYDHAGKERLPDVGLEANDRIVEAHNQLHSVLDVWTGYGGCRSPSKGISASLENQEL